MQHKYMLLLNTSSLPARSQTTVKAPRFYLPELDAVRFTAFLAVFCFHLANRQPGAHSAPVLALINALGFGLPLFFVLSGYLISTLLLKEFDRTGAVSLRKFYQRRMLRIWPLYLLIIGIWVVLAVHRHLLSVQWPWFVAALMMGANLVASPAMAINHLWSISVEEQFYLIWPALMKRLPKIGRRGLFSAALGTIVLGNFTLAYLHRVHAPLGQAWGNSFVQFEMIAAGILLALSGVRVLRPAWCRVAMLSTVPILWFVASYLCRITYVTAQMPGLTALCTGYALVAISCVMVIYAVLGWHQWPRWMTYLGKISYGLYVFHAPMICLFHQLPTLLRGLCAMTATVALASMSYRFFETPFLRYKEGLEIVHTGLDRSSSTMSLPVLHSQSVLRT